ncbi:ATP-binding response regulator [Desulfogranum mediterraneum]|uniref:ATP-binding response regulator n=1 Tax=Desulfogranum mediterraneum TaxID=160661 RepID=UPI00041C6074|nr:DUF3365 domain-containing protein [Desulfogranum mediterraneum]
MRMFDKKRAVTIASFILIFCLLAFFIQLGCKKLSLKEAEESVTGFLLNHKAIHSFVAEVQRPEVFRLQREGVLSGDYFSPILLSRTFIARSIRDALNREREQAGLDTISFKLAAANPRNPLNRADPFESELLRDFNRGKIKEYRAILPSDSGKVLYHAIPVAANSPSCLHCHGDPADAPQEMVQQYGNQAGFFEQSGEIRALISVRVPLDNLLASARSTALSLSGAVFLLFSVFLALVLFFFNKMDQQQQRSEETSTYLDSILQSSTNTAIVVTDRKDTLIYVNQEAERLLNLEAEQILGKELRAVHEVLGDAAINRFNEQLNHLKETGIHRFQLDRQGCVLDIRISAIKDKDGLYQGLLFIGHDVSEQVAAQREQEQTLQKLQKAEKMESIGLMASGVAHDLNNILAGITSYPELMLMNLPEESQLRRPLLAIEAAGHRAAAVVNDLLTVARGATLVKEVVNLNQLIEEYLLSPEHLKMAARYPGVRWETALQPQLNNIYAAPVHCKKCLMNLVGNAVEAMDGSGACRLVTSSLVMEPAMAAELGLAAGAYHLVSVQDSGPGISEEDLPHIFEPFYTRKSMGISGTGLGLSVVWNAMQDHDGTVTARPRRERGMRFDLYFPVCTAVSSAPPESVSLASLQGNKELILVVDDAPHLRDIATLKLIALGYRAEAVGSGEEALQFLREREAAVVLLDMIMDPGISGYETYRRIVEFRPDQKAIIISGYSTRSKMDKAKQLGVGGFIKKPYTITQLGLAIQEVLNRRS